MGRRPADEFADRDAPEPSRQVREREDAVRALVSHDEHLRDHAGALLSGQAAPGSPVTGPLQVDQSGPGWPARAERCSCPGAGGPWVRGHTRRRATKSAGRTTLGLS